MELIFFKILSPDCQQICGYSGSLPIRRRKNKRPNVSQTEDLTLSTSYPSSGPGLPHPVSPLRAGTPLPVSPLRAGTPLPVSPLRAGTPTPVGPHQPTNTWKHLWMRQNEPLPWTTMLGCLGCPGAVKTLTLKVTGPGNRSY